MSERQRLIVRSDALPPHHQTELAALQSVLEKKYGVAAHMLGTMVENLANVCSMVASNLSPAERERAYEQSRAVCGDVISLLGHVLRVEQSQALAVAKAYRDFAGRVEEEMLGDVVLKDTAADAAAAIAKAAAR